MFEVGYTVEEHSAVTVSGADDPEDEDSPSLPLSPPLPPPEQPATATVPAPARLARVALRVIRRSSPVWLDAITYPWGKR